MGMVLIAMSVSSNIVFCWEFLLYAFVSNDFSMMDEKQWFYNGEGIYALADTAKH